jgi:carbon monoxide dehydrogenase subunit G
MSFTVSLAVEREFETPCALKKVFGILADVPESASHFPDVENLETLGGNTYRWTMEKVGVGDYTLQQTVYACTYQSDEGQGRVAWTPVQGEGNALVDGEWRLRQLQSGTGVRLKTTGRLTVDLPGFLQIFLSPLIVIAFTQKIDYYIANLKKTFSAP